MKKYLVLAALAVATAVYVWHKKEMKRWRGA